MTLNLVSMISSRCCYEDVRCLPNLNSPTALSLQVVWEADLAVCMHRRYNGPEDFQFIPVLTRVKSRMEIETSMNFQLENGVTLKAETCESKTEKTLMLWVLSFCFTDEQGAVGLYVICLKGNMIRF